MDNAYMDGYLSGLKHAYAILGCLLSLYQDGEPIDSVMDEVRRQDAEVADALGMYQDAEGQCRPSAFSLPRFIRAVANVIP